jgi:hypothetical protein
MSVKHHPRNRTRSIWPPKTDLKDADTTTASATEVIDHSDEKSASTGAAAAAAADQVKPGRHESADQSRDAHFDAFRASSGGAAAANTGADQCKQEPAASESSCSPNNVDGPNSDQGANQATGQTGANKQRRSRTSFTSEQIEILEQHYRDSTYPNVPTRERIARLTKLSESRIQVSSGPASWWWRHPSPPSH